jgi:hypothetical protein
MPAAVLFYLEKSSRSIDPPHREIARFHLPLATIIERNKVINGRKLSFDFLEKGLISERAACPSSGFDSSRQPSIENSSAGPAFFLIMNLNLT